MAKVSELTIEFREGTLERILALKAHNATVLALGQHIMTVVERDCEKLREEAYALGVDVEVYFDHLVETGSIPKGAVTFFKPHLRK